MGGGEDLTKNSKTGGGGGGGGGGREKLLGSGDPKKGEIL